MVGGVFMDLNKIDKIVSDYVKDESNKKAISTLDTVIPMCERVLTEKLDDYETNKWSRNFNVNDSMKKLKMLRFYLENNLKMNQNIIIVLMKME